MSEPVIGVTMGDPAGMEGIGPGEIRAVRGRAPGCEMGLTYAVQAISTAPIHKESLRAAA